MRPKSSRAIRASGTRRLCPPTQDSAVAYKITERQPAININLLRIADDRDIIPERPTALHHFYLIHYSMERWNRRKKDRIHAEEAAVEYITPQEERAGVTRVCGARGGAGAEAVKYASCP